MGTRIKWYDISIQGHWFHVAGESLYHARQKAIVLHSMYYKKLSDSIQ
jgi:hypothetical protein